MWREKIVKGELVESLDTRKEEKQGEERGRDRRERMARKELEEEVGEG